MAWSRSSRHERGYDSRWDRTRIRILKRDCGLCQCDECQKADAPLPASEVHHRIGKAEGRRLGWSDEQVEADDNLMSVSHACHDRIERAKKGIREKVQVGIDGWPLAAG